MSAPAVPVTMDDITPEWLTAALRAGGKAGDCTVTAIEKVTIGQGVGILGELARLTPAYSTGGSTAPKTLIAKIPTADPGGRGIAEMLGFYEKEVRFYDEVGDRIGVRTAHSYFTGPDPENVRYCDTDEARTVNCWSPSTSENVTCVPPNRSPPLVRRPHDPPPWLPWAG